MSTTVDPLPDDAFPQREGHGKEIERPYATRAPNPTTRAALNEDTSKARLYKTADQLLKALKS